MKKNTVYFMILFAIAGAIMPASFLLGAAGPEAARADEPEIKEQAARGQTSQNVLGISTQEFLDRVKAHAKGQLTPAEAAQQRDRLQAYIAKLNIALESCLLYMEACDKQIDAQNKYQDFLKQLWEKPNAQAFGSFLDWSSEQIKSMVASLGLESEWVKTRLIKSKQELDELDKVWRARKAAEPSASAGTQKANPYSPSWWERVLIAVSLKKNPVATKREIAELSKKASKMKQELDAYNKKLDQKENYIMSHNLAIKLAHEGALKKFYPWGQTLRAIHQNFLDIMNNIELQREALLQILDRERKLKQYKNVIEKE
jgi:hypothetical protein